MHRVAVGWFIGQLPLRQQQCLLKKVLKLNEPLPNCSPGIKALLVREAQGLLEQLVRRILPKFKT